MKNNKTLIIFAAVLIIGFLGTAQNVNNVFAQSSNQDLLAIIEQLKNQIKELQNQFAKLTSEIAAVKEEIKITKELYKGVSGNEVKEVQKFLKQFSEIYPEGLVTGYYGPLTEKAVKKFQERESLSATGKIDETTRSKINEYLTSGSEKKIEAQPTVASPVPESVPTKPVAVPVESATPTAITTPTVITGTITPISASSVTQFITPGGYDSGYAYAVTTDGSVLCWSTQGAIVTPAKIPGSALPVFCSLKDIARIAPGSSHSCAVKTDGSAICWGNNQYGQLGNGTYSDPDDKEISSTPVSVLGLGAGTTADIAVGSNHTCALKKDGSVVCWGNNGVGDYSGGQLGDGTNEPVRFVPTQVSGLGKSTTAAIFPDRAQKNGTCALKTNGAIVCWGESSVIGYSRHQTPIPAPDLTPGAIKDLSILRKGFCALKTDDSVICAGRNIEGQLGGNIKIGNSIFTQVSGLTKGTTAAIAPGVYHTCALKKDGSVVCWGENSNGLLGDGTIFFKYTPVSVLGLGAGTTVAISAGSDSTCVLKTDGLVVCWPGGKTAEGKTTRAPALVPLIGR